MLRDTRAHFNEEQGGFEHGAPKFPHPGAVELALLQWHLSEESDWRVIAEGTLYAMGDGGIYDQLGGGFHRYSTDAAWTVPHFEKMSYYNALLLQNYVHAYRAFGIDFFRGIAEGVWGYITRELTDHERGGFYASQDADNSEHDDGSYWSWSYQEFTGALNSEETPVLTSYYGMRPEGNMPETGRSVLRISERPARVAKALELPLDEVEARIAGGRRKLLQARLRRKMPTIDSDEIHGMECLAHLRRAGGRRAARGVTPPTPVCRRCRPWSTTRMILIRGFIIISTRRAGRACPVSSKIRRPWPTHCWMDSR